MNEDLARLEINLAVDNDVSAYELDELTAAMRRELLQLDVASVERPSAGAAPAGARGIELAELGALIVSLGKATPVLGQVVNVIEAWASRSPNRTVKLTIDGDSLEIGGMSEEDQRRVASDWMARHAKPTSHREPAA
jgi:hypothetical protein